MSNDARACTDAAAAEAADRETRDSLKGALLITPLALSQVEDPKCPICLIPFSEPPGTPDAQEPGQEWAVSIDMVAEWFGPKKCCGHIIGRECLDMHLSTPGQWRNKCPICRDIWFHERVPAHAQWQAAPTSSGSSSSVAPRRSARIAGRVAAESGPSQPRMSNQSGISRASRHLQSQPRPAYFTDRLMAALEVEDGSSEVKGTLDEVNQKLRTLYGGLA